MKAALAILGLAVLAAGFYFLLGSTERAPRRTTVAPIATPGSDPSASSARPGPTSAPDRTRIEDAPETTRSAPSTRETLGTPARRAAGPTARARLSGTLVGAEGPVGGAQLVYQPSSGSAPLEVTSDARGGFTLVFPEEQESGILSIRARGYALFELGVGRLSPGENRALGNLHLARGVVVEGTVVSAAGVAVPGAVVSAASTRNAVRERVHLLTATTDANGAFRMTDAPQGKVRLEARAAGHGARGMDVVAPADGVVLRLAPERELVVRVVDRDGRPIPRADVRLEPREEGSISEFGTTGEDGLATFSDLGSPLWMLVVSATEYRPYSEQDVVAEGELLCELVRWPCVEGRVVGPEGSPPPRGTRVFAAHRTRVSGRMPPTGEGTAPAADGTFRICPVFPGAYEVIVEAPGFARTRSAEVAIPPEGDVGVGTIVLTRGGTLELAIDAPGRRLDGAVVTTFSEEPHAGAVWNPLEESPYQLTTTTPDARGRVLLEGMEVGPTWVLVRSPHYLPLVAGPYGVAAGRVLSPPPLRLEVGGHVAGVVRDGTGKPLSDVLLLIRGGAVPSVVRARTDEAGRFRSSALPTGSYRVWARAVRSGQVPLAAELDATVSAGSTTELAIDL